MKTKQTGFTSIELFVFILWIVAAIGWVWNAVKIIQMVMVDGPIGNQLMLFILRIVGLFAAPLGAILGYF